MTAPLDRPLMDELARAEAKAVNEASEQRVVGHTKTFRERLWNRLGFGREIPPIPDEDNLPYWFRTEWIVRVPLYVRVLFLVSGRLQVKVASAVDQPFVIARSNLVVQFDPPGGWR